MIERHSKVFVPVSADKRLPDKSELYWVYCTHNDLNGSSMTMFAQISHFNFATKVWHVNSKTLTVTHWLEEKENVYVLTEQELKDLLYQYEMKFKNNDLISPTTFLKSKIKI